MGERCELSPRAQLGGAPAKIKFGPF